MDFYEIETAFGGIRERGSEVTHRRPDCGISLGQAVIAAATGTQAPGLSTVRSVRRLP